MYQYNQRSQKKDNLSYTAINIKTRKLLHQMIEKAYHDASTEQLNRYKKFYLKIIPKELSSTSGMYSCKEKLITVYNLSLGPEHVAKTCIHELAHHIDNCNRGKSGHGKEFYAEYKKLLFAALDLGIVQLQDMQSDTWSSDCNKVRAMLKDYTPKQTENVGTCVYMTVAYGFDKRDLLKQNGYHWNGLTKCWEKLCYNPEDENLFLQANNLIGTLVKRSQLGVEAMGKIIVIGKSKQYREILKKLGFLYRNNIGWHFPISSKEAQEYIANFQKIPELKELRFKFIL